MFIGGLMAQVASKLQHLEEIEGQPITIRPVTLDDAEIERDFIEDLSTLSKHYRFLGGVAHLTPEELVDLCDTDYENKMAFVAVIFDKGNEKQIGVSRYAINQYGDSYEFSVAVADEWQNKGLGTLLMKYLIDYAREQGVTRLYSIDFADNYKMKSLAKDLGMHVETDPNDSKQVIYSLYI